MRVLVCGGRDYVDYPALSSYLDRLQQDNPFSHVITGAARGADNLAEQWAKSHPHRPAVLSFPADWRAHGKSAGHIRNRRMLTDGRPDLVIAFPGGRGTANMVKQAREAGVKVIEICE